MQRNVSPQQSPQYAGQSAVYWAYHDEESAAQLSTTVVHALADVLGEDVRTMRDCLHDRVDTRALDLLFRDRPDGSPRVGCTLSFSIYDHRVTVYAGGDVAIEPPADPTPAPR